MAQKTKTISYLEYLLVYIFICLVRFLPYRWSLQIGSGLGALVFKVWSRRRQITIQNLAKVFPAKSSVEIRNIAIQVYRNIGKTLIEFIVAGAWSKNQLLAQVSFAGREHLDAALAKGKGVVFLGAHFGNWELLGIALTAVGYKISVIARPLDNPLLDKIVTNIRAKFGTRIMANSNSIKDVIRVLRKNESIGILMDQNLYENATFVDFFGELAATTPIIPLLAQKTGVAIVPIRMLRLNNNMFKVIIEPELVLKDIPDRQEYVRVNTRLCNEVIERWIKLDPEQWFWVHNRWKTRPGKNS
ncbi:MAG: lysophospholipid acyltransferase family protein [bacterium]|nr:lysophospholipid acyltransferase family protein [bacterium]